MVNEPLPIVTPADRVERLAAPQAVRLLAAWSAAIAVVGLATWSAPLPSGLHVLAPVAVAAWMAAAAGLRSGLVVAALGAVAVTAAVAQGVGPDRLLERALGGLGVWGAATWAAWLSAGRPVPARLRARARLSLVGRSVGRDLQRQGAAWQRSAWLARATGLFHGTLNERSVAAALARAACPELARLCTVDLVDGDQVTRDIGYASPDGAAVAARLRAAPLRLDRDDPLTAALAARDPIVLDPVAAADLDALAQSPPHREALQAIDAGAVALVPMVHRGRALGVVTFFLPRGRPLAPADLQVLGEAVRRAALALDHARRYRRAQETARRKHEDLAVLDTFLREAPIGLAFVGRDLRFIRVSASYAAMSGQPASEHVGHAVRDAQPLLADRLEPVLERVLATGAAVTGLELSGCVPGLGDHARRWTLSGYPIHGPDGHPVGVGLVQVDVTEQRESEEERALLVRELEAAVAARDEFLSVASHELNTPLTPLLLQVQMLRRQVATEGAAADPQRLGQRVETVERQIERLAKLVKELLDLSRITSSRLRLQLEPCDLAALTREVVTRHAHDLHDAGCAVTLAGDEAVPGHWDRMRLDQVVTNLLTNAMRYGARGPIHLSVTAAGDRARLEVRDRGAGIRPEDQQRIFERFERGASSRHYGGLGLGLWIVRQIVEALGGRIGVDSAPGQGSTFWVELPTAGPADRDD